MPERSDTRLKGEAVTRFFAALALVALVLAGCAKSMTAAVPPPAPPPPPPPVKREPAPPPKPPPVKPEPPPPPPAVLSSELSPEEEARLKREAESRISGAERASRRIDERRLAVDQLEILSTIRSFLAKAKEALAAKDFFRAFNLADKARTLAEELLRPAP